MELKGKWACPDYCDSQINITEDGRVSCEFAELGEYGVTPEFAADGDKIRFSACGIAGELKRDGGRLNGKCTRGGKTEDVSYILVPAEPEIKPYHHVLKSEPVEVPPDYPLGINELVGNYQSNVPFNVQLNI